MLLHDILPGTHCFVDANIFYYHLVDTPPLSQECSEFFKRVRTKDLAASTSSAQIAEAMHKVMMAEAVAKHGFDRPGLAHRLQRRRELIAAFSDHEKVPALVRTVGIRVEPVTLAILEMVPQISAKFRLLTK